VFPAATKAAVPRRSYACLLYQHGTTFFIKEAASHHGASLHSPNSSLCIFFSSTQRNTLSKLNLHKQQGKQTRDRKKKRFFADTKQQARNNIKNGKA